MQSNAGWRPLFKFLQRSEKSSAPGRVRDSGNDEAASQVDGPPTGTLEGNTFEGTTSSDFEPAACVIGLDAARSALARLSRSKPSSMHFIAAPRTSSHAKAVADLLAGLVQTLNVTDAVVLAQSFEREGGLQILRLPADVAVQLSAGVAGAIEMLSVTLPAAFESDSYTVASLALEEELRSGHDGAIDALKRKAQMQNIGILRTPQGYAVAPMHEGRLVGADVFKALPDGLKSDVEAKLSAFESDLSGVLSQRTVLQHEYWSRLRDLDGEVASLTVRAALDQLSASAAKVPLAAAYLEALRSDLTRNAALFVAASRRGRGRPRAPVEIANDPRLARYCLTVLGSHGAKVVVPQGLDRADLCGVISTGAGQNVAPASIRPGALLEAGSGFVMIEARELTAQFDAWPLLKRAFQSGSTHPLESPVNLVSKIALPIAARLIVTGDTEDFIAWSQMDQDVTRLVAFMTAFEPAVALSAPVERDFAAVVSSLVASCGLMPLDGPALAALMHEHTDTTSGMPMLSTDLDALDEILDLADQSAKSRGHTVTEAGDVLAALKQRADGLGVLALPSARGPAPGRGRATS